MFGRTNPKEQEQNDVNFLRNRQQCGRLCPFRLLRAAGLLRADGLLCAGGVLHPRWMLRSGRLSNADRLLRPADEVR